MAKAQSKVDLNRKIVIEASVRCIARGGVARATMSAIADEAGMSRMTLYRLFDDRDAILKAILVARFTGMFDDVRLKLATFSTLEEALVEGGLYAIGLVEQDALSHALIAEATNHLFGRFLINYDSAISGLYYDAWRPAFEKARQSGELTGRLSDDRLIEGARSIMNVALLQSNLDEDARRSFLRDFLVPAILGRRRHDAGEVYP